MKNYLVFIGDEYYPHGGMEDFRGDFDSLKEAKSFTKKFITENDEKKYVSKLYDWWAHIYSSKKKKIVFENSKRQEDRLKPKVDVVDYKDYMAEFINYQEKTWYEKD